MLKSDKIADETIAKEAEDKKNETESKDWMAEKHQKEKRQKMIRDPNNMKLLLDPTNVAEFKDAVALLTARVDDRSLKVRDMYEALKGMLSNKRVSIKV